ncbi:MAG: hypothetical protein II859_12705 [Bacteroidales bacterium]|nr:hypothetical protein [Bacteroidales bacterium]
MKKMIRLDLDRRSPVMEIINMSENDVSRLILALKFCNEMCKDTNLDIYTEQEKEAILKKMLELQTLLEDEYGKCSSKTAVGIEEEIITKVALYWK